MQASPQVVRFEIFELDLKAEELRKNRRKLKLRGQPFQVLATLLERPGEVVTREELQQKLWPDGTFVDFDHSLNTAINKIREVLGDSAENPRFVETIPRRGYRFIAPLEGSRVDADLRADTTTVGPSETSGNSGSLSASPHTLQPVSKTRWPGWLWWAAALTGLGLISLVVVFWLGLPLSHPRVTSSKRLTHDGMLKGSHVFHSPIMTDGTRVYFFEVAKNSDTSLLSQVSVAGGETGFVSSPLKEIVAYDISLKRSELLVWGRLHTETFAQASYWALPLPGGTPRRLSDELRGAGGACWSPDGEQIAYAKEQAFYVASSDGSGSRKLATVSGTASDLRWSPDGSRLRFSLSDDMSEEISLWEVEADGSNLHPLLPGWNDPPGECCGNWTPDGHYYVFQSTRDGRTDVLALRESQGWLSRRAPELTRLTAGPLHFSAPVVGLDGKKIFVMGDQPRGELMRYEKASGRFVPYLGGISAYMLDFSRDGQWVVYVSYPENSLWRSDLKGGQRLQVTSPPLQAAFPQFSPDGRKVAFMGKTRGRPWRSYLVPAEGGSLQTLMPDHCAQTFPTWSPDGNRLAFSFWSFAAQVEGIQVLDLRTKQITTLPGSADLGGPRWSHDGRYIGAGNASKSMIFDLTTQTWTEFQPGGGIVFGSRDGKFLDFLMGDTFYRLRISDRKVEPVASFGEYANQAVVWSFGLAADGSPMFLRSISNQEIYALDWEAP
jgi:Tol biopolymer transport system component/DNA-binding winged helix-turn-helix (wHTH) protein